MKLSVEQTLMRAKSHAQKGEIDQANELYRSILSTFPKNKRAQQALAHIRKPVPATTAPAVNPSLEQLRELATLLTKGRTGNVIEKTKALVERFPSSAALWDILGGAYKASGQLADAETAFRKAAEFDPKSHQIQNNLGATLRASEKRDEAIAAYKQALTLRPDYAEAHYNLGIVLADCENFKEAISSYQQALQIKPDYIEAFVGLGNAFKEQGKLGDSISAFRKAIELKPDYAEAYCDMAGMLRDEGELDDAIAAYRKALILKPRFANAYFNMASALKEKGQLDEAISAYQEALSIRPNFAACYAEATALRGFPIDEELEERLVEFSRNKDLTAHEQRHLKYALYNVCNRLKKYQDAFNWLVEAAEVRRKELDYTIREDHVLFKQIYARAPEYLRNYEFTYKATKTPIFIVGMPRSGTTLTEQIISSHSAVYGAGELTMFPKLVLPLIKEKEFSPKHVLRLRVKYLEYIDSIAGDNAFVTDKMPHNFRFLPMICAALPEAKVVHIHRDPRATCWSNFTSNFRSAQLGYSFNLDAAVEYYKIYCTLVREWARVLGDKVYHLSYEALIEDQEGQTRQLLDYLGLDW
ncbi:tetratricopeptide repeat-containing sulfotransferase family protein [Marivita sp.]|uniref:tetratricopeptide repeat-containing sulfotransferase family protein n=1 Tax=Marivita sp. TaxID=2003365 RepID=UPI0025C6A3AC|nr:tetratricopeptide repeat-containing sulfotransferase family protein [Marivita sp.]